LYRQTLLGLALLVAFSGVAVAQVDADLCGDDAADATTRAEACSRLIRSGKYRGNNLAVVHNNRGIAYRRQNDLTRAHAEYTEALRLNPQYAKAH
jgi:tetratricopeptide (TPR) repeat protein